MDKVKSWFKSYFKSFTFKRIGIILGLTVLAFGFVTLGDYLEENNHYGLMYDICTFVGVFGLPIVYLIYEIVLVIKSKKVSLAELSATFTILMIWINLIGIVISLLVSDNIWIVKQDTSKFLNGLEYVIIMLFSNMGVAFVTFCFIIVALVMKLVKKIKERKNE